MDILIVKLGALGDAINTLPLVISLKTHLKARIDWLIEPLSYPLISDHPYVDRVILFDKYKWPKALLDTSQHLGSKKYDMTLDLQRILKSGFFSMLAKSDRRIGFDRKRCKEMTWMLPFERIPESDPKAHMVYQYLEFADYIGIPNIDVRWELPISEMRPDGLPEKYIVLNIGATKPVNRWTPEGFSSLAHAIYRKYHLPCIITGGPEDHTMAKNIMSLSDDEVLNFVGKTSLKELQTILFNARVVFSCDTGPMHLAVALGKDVVALFGPSDPRRTGNLRGEVVLKPLHCSPCNLRTCKDPVCMTSITHEEVLERIENIL
ncbi:MAG: glycosyltransferase family 9 protein [Desulfobacterales bacterium]|nr:MAG: glycosyltransferase family 9 protein [Desulfobacterales bacterium]